MWQLVTMVAPWPNSNPYRSSPWQISVLTDWGKWSYFADSLVLHGAICASAPQSCAILRVCFSWIICVLMHINESYSLALGAPCWSLRHVETVVLERGMLCKQQLQDMLISLFEMQDAQKNVVVQYMYFNKIFWYCGYSVRHTYTLLRTEYFIPVVPMCTIW